MSQRPIARSIPYRDPVGAFQSFAAGPFAMLLDSAAPAGGRGRFAYIAADPYRVLTAKDGLTLVDGRPVTDDPFQALERELGRVAPAAADGLPPFRGGAVGYLGYELGGRLERLPTPKAKGLDVPDMAVGLYDTVAAFDLPARQAWVIAADPPAAEPDPARPSPAERAARMAARIA
ncbi:MAG TPA: aminodeoxychorismate/anthranilate synthase component I, partial [Rhodospirillales bacterium]